MKRGRLRNAIWPWVELACDERGTAYNLGFTLLMPFYVLFIVFSVELALLLNTKMAVTHAAYAGARAATVWLNTDELPPEAQLGMIHVAAVNALAPIASGKHHVSGDRDLRYPREAPHAWARSYLRQVTSRHQSDYLARKWVYAARATRISIRVDPPRTPEGPRQVTVMLLYEHPFHTNGAGRILGHLSPWLRAPIRSQTVSSTITLGIEDPRTESLRLGVPIQVDFGFRSREGSELQDTNLH